jgi:DNA-binding NarL/FixJ family response regulator
MLMVASAEEIRIVIADDHTLFREGLSEILAREPEFRVVAQANSGLAVIAETERTSPDIVVLDVEMPGPSAEETIAVLCTQLGVRTVVLTMHDDPDLAERLITAGAHAYIVKGVERAELLGTIRGVMKDDDHVVISVSRESMSRLREPAVSPLSSRELEVLTAVSVGLSNAQIAERLFITEGTVKRHLTNIYMKLDVTTRVNGINKAIAMGLIPPKKRTH